MHKSARTAQTIRPLVSGSSTMHPATGQAAWQIEHANAPKHRSGSITAIVLGAFLRGPLIIFVHMVRRLYIDEPVGRRRSLTSTSRLGDRRAAHRSRASR